MLVGLGFEGWRSGSLVKEMVEGGRREFYVVSLVVWRRVVFFRRFLVGVLRIWGFMLRVEVRLS